MFIILLNLNMRSIYFNCFINIYSYTDLLQSVDFSEESIYPYNGAVIGITIQRIVEKAAACIYIYIYY